LTFTLIVSLGLFGGFSWGWLEAAGFELPAGDEVEVPEPPLAHGGLGTRGLEAWAAHTAVAKMQNRKRRAGLIGRPFT
jgi:hypothetical protein